MILHLNDPTILLIFGTPLLYLMSSTNDCMFDMCIMEIILLLKGHIRETGGHLLLSVVKEHRGEHL